MSGPILGIDIGGTKLAVGLAAADGMLLAEARQASGAEEGPDPVIGRILELARGVVEEAGIGLDAVERIGIGCGGPLDPWRGVIHNALNMPGWIDIPIVARIEQELGRPAFLDNDGKQLPYPVNPASIVELEGQDHEELPFAALPLT